MQSYAYDRAKAVAYARKWAFKRNPEYLDFERLGGDCTNFASQSIYAGCLCMNYTPVYGWFYKSSYQRTASWTGVEYLYKFLISNRAEGPYARSCDPIELQPGDIIQLSFYGNDSFGHSLVVVKNELKNNTTDIMQDNHNKTNEGNEYTEKLKKQLDQIYVATHTIDRLDYKLSNYTWDEIRFLHIEGYRKY